MSALRSMGQLHASVAIDVRPPYNPDVNGASPGIACLSRSAPLSPPVESSTTMTEKFEKVDELRLEPVDSKHSHPKDNGGISIHDPAANDAEQLVHDHDEFTPQEYKKLMLKVDLILMPMLMISEYTSALRGLLRVCTCFRISFRSAPDAVLLASKSTWQWHQTNFQSMVCSSPTRRVFRPVSFSASARTHT